jgi:hypothetical protein
MELHALLRNKPGFDPETLLLMKDMVADLPHKIAVALTSVATIASECAAYAQRTGNSDVMNALKDFSSNLFGMEDNQKPVEVLLSARTRTR